MLNFEPTLLVGPFYQNIEHFRKRIFAQKAARKSLSLLLLPVLGIGKPLKRVPDMAGP